MPSVIPDLNKTDEKAEVIQEAHKLNPINMKHILFLIIGFFLGFFFFGFIILTIKAFAN